LIDRLFTLKAAAAHFGIPYRTLLELIEVGALEAVDLRVNGAVRPRWWVHLSAVEQMLEARTQNKRIQRTERMTSTTVPRFSEPCARKRS
jgi:hypothetical protein